MEKAEFKYFLNGEEVDGSLINWEYSTTITNRGNEIHVEYAPEDVDNIYGYLDEPVESVFDDIFGGLLLNGLLSNMQMYRPSNQLDVESIECSITDVSSMCEDEPKVTSETPEVGVKHNKYKAPLDIVQTRQFPKALQMLALATAFGNKKYADTDRDFLNFKRVKGGSQTYFDAAARHNANRNEIDEDSSLPHVIHAVWDMMAALEMSIEENNIDVKEYSKEYLEYLHMSE